MDAYGDFIDEAGRGPFRAPEGGGWTAEQIVAHVATNNERLIATTEALLAGHEAAYDNHDAIGVGELRGLADRVAETVAVLRDLAGQLGQVGDTPVPARIQDGDEIVLDGPVPWAQLLQINATRHAQMHLDQLRALRIAD